MSSHGCLILIVALPFIGTGGLILLHNRPDAREVVSLVDRGPWTFLLCLLVIPSAFAAGGVSTLPLFILPGALPPGSLPMPSGSSSQALASFLWDRNDRVQHRLHAGPEGSMHRHGYYACFAVCIGGSHGGLRSQPNLFSLFVFYEILAIAAYPLVVHIETAEALAAGRKYLLYTQAGGVSILAGIMAPPRDGKTRSTLFAGGNPGIAAMAPDFARLAFFLLLAGFCRQGSAHPRPRVACPAP